QRDGPRGGSAGCAGVGVRGAGVLGVRHVPCSFRGWSGPGGAGTATVVDLPGTGLDDEPRADRRLRRAAPELPRHSPRPRTASAAGEGGALASRAYRSVTAAPAARGPTGADAPGPATSRGVLHDLCSDRIPDPSAPHRPRGAPPEPRREHLRLDLGP